MKRNVLNCRKAALVLCLCIGCCLYVSRGLAAEVSEEGSIVEERGGLLYLPAGIETGVVYPLLIAFSSDGDAAWYLDHLMALADEYTWIVFASSGFDEDASMIEVVNPLADLLPVLAEEYPVDLENVFTCGYDEGGSCAYYFAWAHPDRVTGVIADNAVIGRDDLGDALLNAFPERKKVVLITSDDQQVEREMDGDADFLADLEWKIEWLENEEGDLPAPEGLYRAAIGWIEDQIYPETDDEDPSTEEEEEGDTGDQEP